MNDEIRVPGHRMTERVGSLDHSDPDERGRSHFVCECGWQIASPKRGGALPDHLCNVAGYHAAMGHLAEFVIGEQND